MSASTAEDESVRGREKNEVEFDCKDESDDCRKHTRECKKDLDKACTSSWGHCQINLSERIESQTGF